MNSWKLDNQFLFERHKLNFVKIWWLNIDKLILGIVLFLMLFGLFMNFTSSPAIAKRIDVDQLFFLKKHLIFAIGGFFLLIFFSYLKTSQIKLVAPPLFIAIILCLIITLIFGNEIKGAKRWISVFGFTLQPSEFAKVIFVIFNAYLLDRFHREKFYIKYGISAAFCLLLVLLLILQPDFGMSFMVILLWSVQLFLYGLPWFAVFAISLLGIGGIILAYISLPHVRERLNSFFDVNKDYQIQRSLDAYVNGGVTGTGPGNGLVKKYIPDSHSDFIFSVVGEELGLLISAIIIFIFLLLITRVIRKNSIYDGYFSYLVIGGIIIQFAVQIIINIGVSLAMLPTKGITLPFISYGGSSLFSMSMAFGIILAMTRQKYHNRIKDSHLLLSTSK